MKTNLPPEEASQLGSSLLWMMSGRLPGKTWFVWGVRPAPQPRVFLTVIRTPHDKEAVEGALQRFPEWKGKMEIDLYERE